MVLSAAPHRSVLTHCRVCAAACGVYVEAEGDRLLRLTGDPDDPVSRGYTCAKGRAAIESHESADRLDTPRRAGPARRHRAWRPTRVPG